MRFIASMKQHNFLPAVKISSANRAVEYTARPMQGWSNCKFNVDANSGHAFGILLAAVGTLRPSGSGAS